MDMTYDSVISVSSETATQMLHKCNYEKQKQPIIIVYKPDNVTLTVNV